MGALPCLSGSSKSAEVGIPAARLGPEEGAAVRASLFDHIVGLAFVPVVAAAAKGGCFRVLSKRSTGLTVRELASATAANPGYLAVAARALAAAGWLQETSHGERGLLTLTEVGREGLQLLPMFVEAAESLPALQKLEDLMAYERDDPARARIGALTSLALSGWGRPAEDSRRRCGRWLRYLDGVLLGPALVAWRRLGVLDRLLTPLERGREEPWEELLSLLERPGWARRDGGALRLTSAGMYAARIAGACGVTVSYLPLLAALPGLIFPRLRPACAVVRGDDMVDRSLNVWASGEAHRAYFARCANVVTQIFDRPLGEQPAGICDMGCGDGTLLMILYEAVRTKTTRGALLSRHPLHVIGADCSPVARDIARDRLARAGVRDVNVIPGDVGQPTELGRALRAARIAPDSVLHVRSFVDHNRRISAPDEPARAAEAARLDDVFSLGGRLVDVDWVEADLARHLAGWAPLTQRFGMLIVELHTLGVDRVQAGLNTTPSLAYDITHGFSDQVLVKYDMFLRAATAAGFRPEPKLSARLPAEDRPMISVSWLRSAAQGS